MIHIFLSRISEKTKVKINCIPVNEEKYISFTKKIVVDEFLKKGQKITNTRDVRFIDSFKFVTISLDYLVNNPKGIF